MTFFIQTAIVIYKKSNYIYLYTNEEEHSMIMVLSTIIAFILTALLVCLLYPVAVIFWFAGKVGEIVGIIGNWIFNHTNAAIKYLWADLRNSSQNTSDHENNSDIA